MAIQLKDHIEELIVAKGLGNVCSKSIKIQQGRNSNFLLRTDSGNQLFIKSVIGEGENPKNAIRSTLLAESKLWHDGLKGKLGDVKILKLKAYDEERSIMIYDAISDVRNLAEYLNDSFTSPDMIVYVEQIGCALAQLHCIDIGEMEQFMRPFQTPPIGWFDALPWGSFSAFSSPLLVVWGRLQDDQPLKCALNQLILDEGTAKCCFVHGDVRLDQFLIDKNNELWLIDWEEFRVGDPARDVGAIIGELLHVAIVAISKQAPTILNSLNGALTHEEILEIGSVALDNVTPLIHAFWDQYSKNKTVDEVLLKRVLQFAGWHLFDRLLAASETQNRVTAFSWAAAGIGRKLLLDPLTSAETLRLKS